MSKVKSKTKYQYFKITKEREQYKGQRYFRMNFDDEYVTQVCLLTGEPKRGIGASIGMYLITKLTFFSNYLNFYVEPTTKAQWDNAVKKVNDILK